MTGSHQFEQPQAEPTAPLRVLIVADPGFVGDRVKSIIEADPRLSVAGQVADGVAAVSALRRQVVDGVVIDIGHPEAQIKVTLGRMLRVDPQLKVLMVGSLIFANVKTSMMGLMEGAAEFVATPGTHTRGTDREFAARLCDVLVAFGPSARSLQKPSPLPLPDRTSRTGPKTAAGSHQHAVSLRPAPHIRPDVIAIGSSTGGPQALFTVLAMLPADLSVPVIITQHMPASFTELLASHINKHSALSCAEGKHGEALQPGRIYLAPGDYHMTVRAGKDGPTIALDQGPPVNYCRPAVDPMFESAQHVFGGKVLAVVLTGMGNDGTAGGRAIADAGGIVIAQDEASSVVWGMPGAAAEAGICSAVLALDDIGEYIAKALKVDW